MRLKVLSLNNNKLTALFPLGMFANAIRCTRQAHIRSFSDKLNRLAVLSMAGNNFLCLPPDLASPALYQLRVLDVEDNPSLINPPGSVVDKGLPAIST